MAIARLLPFHGEAPAAGCEELDRWQDRLAWRDWHGRTWGGRLRRDAEAEAVAESVIMEGVPVTEVEVRRILAGDHPPEVSAEATRLVEGYREAVSYALRRSDDPAFRWQSELILAVHDRILGGNRAAGGGRFTDRARWLAASGTGRKVFDPPPHQDVAPLVDVMCEQLNSSTWHPAVAAAWVHAATAAIHPFRDGNGRCARVLASLAMYRGGFRLWAFTTLESWWGRHRDAYHGAFRCLGTRFDATADATPFLLAHIGAQVSQVRALDLRERVEHRIWGAIVGAIEDIGLDERVANAVWEAFFEREVTAGYYRGLVDVSPATATHDLRAATAGGLLSAHGERRARRYLAGARLHERIGSTLGLGEMLDRAAIVGMLTERVGAEWTDGDISPGTLRDRAERRIYVRELHEGGNAALDYHIEVRDDGFDRRAVRASLSTESWEKIGHLIGKSGLGLPAGPPTGDAALVIEAFIDVAVEMLDEHPSSGFEPRRVTSVDDGVMDRIAQRVLERMGPVSSVRH